MPSRKAVPLKAEEIPPDRDWYDWLERLQSHFGRFSWDLGGILLLAFSLMTLLALTGLTRGLLLTAWSAVLQRWFGWGSFLVVLATAAGGVILLRKNSQPVAVRWGRVVALEVAAFFALALVSIAGAAIGISMGGTESALERAASGWDGGLIGWSLAELLNILLGPVWRDLLVVLGLILFVMLGFGLFGRIEAWIVKMAGEDAQLPNDFKSVQTAPPSKAPESDVAGPAVKSKPAEKSRKASRQLPPEFRKSFKVRENQDSKPAAPPKRGERLPPLAILFAEQSAHPDERTINQTAGLIEKTLSEFGIPATVIGFRVGPAVTQFAVRPGFIKKPGSNEDDAQLMKVRVAQIAALQKDLALALSAERLRIEAPVPGRSYVGIEVPNLHTSMVRLRPILETDAFYRIASPLAIALGRDVSGQPVVADLARMPHLLIAGATGSGKSVCITSLASCLAMNNPPEDLRLVLIDSKMVELIRFNGLPHLLGKVETDIKRIMGVLRWVVVEMEHRYRLLESAKARDIDVYNRKILSRRDGGSPLPRIVVMIDELADLMMSAPDQTEHNLVRLAQMARATGIHLIVATQRPSTDVVTGLIKANFPARIAFAVAAGVDSRVILDMPGAETLLGRGDMLFLNPEVGNPQRAQGVYVTDQEIERIIAFWQKIAPPDLEASPWETMLTEPEAGGDDALAEKAIQIVRQSQRASASLLQRRLRIGYPRAARLLDQLEDLGVVGPSQGGGRERDVLLGPDENIPLDAEDDEE
jgi:S-DNA-T family DNA segregation ATPase FtsK/SpoIIIE